MAALLVLDDYDGFREAMAYCLPKFGHAVTTAPVSGFCPGLFQKERPDIAVISVGPSSAKGFDACKSLRADQKFRDVPIIILANPLTVELEIRARAAGAAAVLALPFNWPELLTIVQRVSSGSEQQWRSKD